MKYFLFLILSVFSIFSYSQIVTDRPDQTESSSTVGQSALQVESGILISYEGEGLGSSKQLLAPTTLFRYGLTKSVELRLLSQWEKNTFFEKEWHGISDLEIGTKIQLLQDDNINTEIAFLSHLLIPTGSAELTDDRYATLNKIAISHELSDKLGLGYNLGYNYFGEGKGDLTYSLALGYSLNETTGVYIEPYGEFVNMEDFILNFDAGFTYLIRENFQLDFSFGSGLNHRMNYLAAGFSWLLNDLYE